MIHFIKDKDGFTFELTLYPKCWWFNHNYGKWGEPRDSYSGRIKQSRECLDCGKIQVRSIGYHGGLYARGISLPAKEIN